MTLHEVLKNTGYDLSLFSEEARRFVENEIFVKTLRGKDMEIRSYVNKYGSPGFEVILGGDCELETTIRALKFITKVLEEEAAEVYD